jgi:hypothetical protein
VYLLDPHYLIPLGVPRKDGHSLEYSKRGYAFSHAWQRLGSARGLAHTVKPNSVWVWLAPDLVCRGLANREAPTWLGLTHYQALVWLRPCSFPWACPWEEGYKSFLDPLKIGLSHCVFLFTICNISVLNIYLRYLSLCNFFSSLIIKLCFWAIKFYLRSNWFQILMKGWDWKMGDWNEKHGKHRWRTISFENIHFCPLT